ncbi:hypothetical protein QA635_00855 [Bradyrhizobium brasilense]|uniref:hypothetical protein n=1 Tax=Bradyrhizobium TaxID=374 RepID=UPI0015A0AF86|nr:MULTISPECIES: hypothetical protein [Bradyrhizobium]MCA1401353.1 hypothetical protein [Bradyrhizobium sp. BRP56]MCC8971476.1 hypothetical protein [Bradyrhizobium brasilense]WFU33047.1 hypothetical protein QA635_00855 [Bradyrhizobium australafricanum]
MTLTPMSTRRVSEEWGSFFFKAIAASSRQAQSFTQSLAQSLAIAMNFGRN